MLWSTGVTSTEFVAVLMIEIEGVGKVLSGNGALGCTSSRTVVMSFALAT